MNRLIADIIEPIDGKTSRAICDAVGERLQRDLRPERLASRRTCSILWMNCANGTARAMPSRRAGSG